LPRHTIMLLPEATRSPRRTERSSSTVLPMLRACRRTLAAVARCSCSEACRRTGISSPSLWGISTRSSTVSQQLPTVCPCLHRRAVEADGFELLSRIGRRSASPQIDARPLYVGFIPTRGPLNVGFIPPRSAAYRVHPSHMVSASCASPTRQIAWCDAEYVRAGVRVAQSD